MKAISVLMILIGLAIGVGGVIEIRAYPPDAMEFWVGGVVAVISSLLSIAGGIVLWQRRSSAHRVAFIAASMMVAVTAVATALRVMGVLAAIIGIAGSLVVIGWIMTRDTHDPIRS